MIQVNMQFKTPGEFIVFCEFMAKQNAARFTLEQFVGAVSEAKGPAGPDVVDAEVIEVIGPPSAPPTPVQETAPAEVLVDPTVFARAHGLETQHTQEEVSKLLRRYGTQKGLAAAKAVLTEHGLGRVSDEGAEAQYNSLFEKLTALLA